MPDFLVEVDIMVEEPHILLAMCCNSAFFFSRINELV